MTWREPDNGNGGGNGKSWRGKGSQGDAGRAFGSSLGFSLPLSIIEWILLDDSSSLDQALN